MLHYGLGRVGWLLRGSSLLRLFSLSAETCSFQRSSIVLDDHHTYTAGKSSTEQNVLCSQNLSIERSFWHVLRHWCMRLHVF